MSQAVMEAMFAGITEGFVGITRIKNGDVRTEFFPVENISGAYTYALSQNRQGYNVYFGVKALAKMPIEGRGKTEDPGYINCMWADYDYGFDGHKRKDNPPDQQTVFDLLAEFPLKPSVVVFTGHGIHPYWLLKEPIDATTEEGMDLASKLIKGVQGTLIQKARAHSWNMDNTSDLARIMRVPGSYNYKEGKKVQGQVLEFNTELRYSIDEIRKACPPEVVATKKNAGIKPSIVTNEEGKVSMGSRHDSYVTAAYALLKSGASNQVIGASLHAINETQCEESLPEEEVDAITRSFSKYDPRENITSLVLAAKEGLRNALPQISLEPAKVYETETIGFLAVLSLYDQTAYSQVKAQIKGVCKNKIPAKELEMAVRGEVGKLRAARQEEKEPSEELFPGLGYQLTVPKGYRMDQRGVAKYMPDGLAQVFPSPVTISRRFRNPQTGLEMVELAYVRDGEVYYATAERSVAFSRHKIMELADCGLPVTSENAKDLVIFLSELEQQNAIPRVSCSASLGWTSENAILPHDSDAAFLDKRGFEQLADAFGQKGTLPDWIKLTTVVRSNVFGRLMLAAAYGSLLVEIVGVRTAGILLWGCSQAGKTAILKAAASIFGHPEKLMISMFATKVAIEQLAGFLRHFAMYIDERQMAGSDQAMENLVYTISGGEGKSRGQKNGGVRTRGHWENLVLMTGEHPISNESSAAGVRGRLLEVNVTQVVENETGSKLHRELPRQYGSAGPVYIEHIKSIRPDIRHRFDQWLDKARTAFPEISGSHVSLLALLGLADELASVAVYGEGESVAAKGAWAFVEALSVYVIKTADMDDAEKAKNHVISMYLENRRRFEGLNEHEYGQMQGGELKIVPSVLNRFLHDGGYNPQRAKADFVRMGWMRTFEDRNGKKADKRFERSSYGYGCYNGYYNYLTFPELSQPQGEKRLEAPLSFEPAEFTEGNDVSPDSLV